MVIDAGQELDRDTLFKRLLSKAENRRCFDCMAPNPKWCSWRFGVLICMDCAALHRQMGVHISQVKSCELDQWTHDQLLVYESSGGNKRATLFFQKHASHTLSGTGGGGSMAAALQVKYTSAAAQTYKKALAKEVQQKLASAATPAAPAPVAAAPAAAAPAAKPAKKTSLGAARTSAGRRPASARRPGGLGATRKKGGLGGGGLGAKKITTKVDDSLFTQAPEEKAQVVAADPAPSQAKNQEPKPDAAAVAAAAACTAPTTTSRFIEPEEPEEEAPPKIDLRGSDGHVSLSKLMQSGNQKPSGGLGAPRGRGVGLGRKQVPRNQAASASASSEDAQKRFSGAKSISSQQFFGESKADEMEKHQRLSKFQGATSISSADYYGGNKSGQSGGSSPRSDMDASELIGRLSMQAKMDMQNLKGMASNAKSKFFNFARDMQNRYG